MRSIALALVIIGIGALVYGVIDYSNSRTTIEMGSMSASITENGARSMTAIIGGAIAVIVGLMMYSKERRHVS